MPHNLVSAQESPVTLPKFQMAPRLKFLMTSGTKKGTQIYISFLSMVPAIEPPSGSPTGPLWRQIPISRAFINLLTPNDHYRGRTAKLTSKRCILYIYSTNIGTEYFKHGIYSPFLSVQNAVYFIILTYLVPDLFNLIYRMC